MQAVMRLLRSIVTRPQAKVTHDRYPEVLNWRKGDRFYVFHWNGRTWCGLTLESVADDGWAYCNDSGNMVKIPVSALLPYNDSARGRAVSAEMKRSREYMELLEQFQKAVEELRQHDSNRFGGPIE